MSKCTVHSADSLSAAFRFFRGYVVAVHRYSPPCFPFVVRPSAAISSASFFSVRFFDCKHEAHILTSFDYQLHALVDQGTDSP
jgi:hypothetical protein